MTELVQKPKFLYFKKRKTLTEKIALFIRHKPYTQNVVANLKKRETEHNK
jgi:hypothetical protein